jgi:hypothetical protein
MELAVDPWFMRERAVLFAFASLTSLLYLLEPYARRGQLKGAVLGSCGAVLLAGVAMLIAAMAGHATGQPRYVTFTLELTGGLVAFSGAWGLVQFWWHYRSAARASEAIAHERSMQT